jgi:hypothetical protein
VRRAPLALVPTILELRGISGGGEIASERASAFSTGGVGAAWPEGSATLEGPLASVVPLIG